MATVVPKSSADSGSNATGFSYAQAAKGRAASAAAPVTQSSSAASSSNTPSKASTPNVDAHIPSVSATGDTEAERSMASAEESSSSRDVTMSESTKPSTVATASPSPSFGTASTSTLPKEEDIPLPPHLAEASWRSPRPKTPGEHHTEGSERRGKGKKKKEKAAEKEAEKEKEKEEVKPEVFVTAPPPAVNIWQQRQEAQAARVKPAESSSAMPLAEPMMNGVAQEQPSKPADTKKKTRPTSSDGAVTTNGVGKGQKKGVDGMARKDDSRRNAPRGARLAEKDEKSISSPAPPPVADGISWPTPETAIEEEKRKALEKGDKDDIDDASSNKPRSKKEWVSVPFTPTVTFNTPLPARGGRGRGGGRGGRESGGRGTHTSNGSVSGEKLFAVANSVAESQERPADASSAARASSLPPNASKKAADSSTNNRDQQKPSSSSEKPKIDLAVSSKLENTQGTSTRDSIPLQVDGQSVTQLAQGVSAGINGAEKADQSVSSPVDYHSQSKASSTERKGDQTLRSGDHLQPNGQVLPRERGEGRGRGGYRGRGGGHNNFVNGQPPFVNGHVQQSTNGYGMRQNSAPYSPPAQGQQGFSNGFIPNGQRGRNPPPRAQSIPTNGPQMYGRFSQSSNGSMQQMGMAGNGVYEYPGQGAMGPYIDWSVFPMVVMQLEYYFSIDNLCKDVFLRRHMDSQGFVFLTFISQFKRIQSLTPELEVLRLACQESDIIEIVTGEDGVDRVRRLDGWEKWVMPFEERDETARIPGPQHFMRQQSYQQREQIGQRMVNQRHPGMSPPLFSPNGSELAFRPYMTGPSIQMSGTALFGEYGRQTESPLSAAVPDFSPGVPINEKSAYPETEVTFTDLEVEQLIIVYNQQDNRDSKVKAPYHTAASRTFSNGSIDSRAINEEITELQNHQSQTSGNQVSER